MMNNILHVKKETLMYEELYQHLIGDGIQDDTAAIQAILDSGTPVIHLPAPKKAYLISRCLKIHSNTSLILDRFAVIRLADHSDCIMIQNAGNDDENISISGGIWDFNNKNQRSNPVRDGSYKNTHDYSDDYLGVIMRFFGIKNFILSSLTLKDPITFAVQMARITQFTVKDIIFDFNYGNPNAMNMDGIHLDGFCRFGSIVNMQGTCFDDLVALNADDLYDGPIEDIAIDGIFARDCHSAVRLLSAKSQVQRIHISNVFGTYYQYCIGITRFYYDNPGYGLFDQIHLSNIFAAKAPRIDIYGKKGSYVYALIWIDRGLEVNSLHISHLHRREEVTAIPTILVEKGTKIESLSVSHASQENSTGEPISFIKNMGEINSLYLEDIRVKNDTLLENEGNIVSLTKTAV
jgi:hypothetical protein